MFLKRRDVLLSKKNSKKFMVCISKKNKVSLVSNKGESLFFRKKKVLDPQKIDFNELGISEEDFLILGNGIRFFL